MFNLPGGLLGVAAVVGAALLGAAIAYAMFQNSRRNRANDRLTEAATRDLYDHPNRDRNDASPNPDKRPLP
jgi:hypothetical protein